MNNIKKGSPTKVTHLKESFLKEIESARKLLESVKTDITPILKKEKVNGHLVNKVTRRIVELSFLRVVTAWEDFIEQAVVNYMAGAQTDDGSYSPSLIMGISPNTKHCYKLIMSDSKFKSDNDYIKGLSSTNGVINIARLYFEDGEPFNTALSAKNNKLEYAKKIRNRVAHSSDKCKGQYYDVVKEMFTPIGEKKSAREVLVLNSKRTIKNIQVGDFLLFKVDRVFPDKNLTIFEAFMSMYSELANVIVP
jgi:hypothetical protein